MYVGVDVKARFGIGKVRYLLDMRSRGKFACCFITLHPLHPTHFFNTSNDTPPHLLFKYVMAQARHRMPSPQNPNDEIIRDIWNGLSPYAARLRNLIMPTPVLDSAPIHAPASAIPQTAESPPQYTVPHLGSRRAACTHLTMERLYGAFECSLCHHSSDFGWVYSCVQDDEPPMASSSHSSMIESRVGKENPRIKSSRTKPSNRLRLSKPGPRPEDTGFRMPTAQLSPWIDKAIKEGHYTAEQIEIMQAQKKAVFETAKAAIERFEESQTNQNTNAPPYEPSTSQSVDANPHLPFPIINEVQDPIIETNAQPKLRMFPHCDFRACQLCRPTFRDRTWQCFGHTFEMETPVDVLSLQDENRPLSSVSVMRTIGLRKRSVRRRPRLGTHDSKHIYTFTQAGEMILQDNPHRRSTPSIPSYYQRSVDAADSTDIADAKAEEPESKGFRESMKRAFKGMMPTRRDSGRSTLPKRKGRDGSESTSTDVDAATFDMGLWQELNDELLREASSVPLPTKNSTGSDRLNEEAGLIEEDIAGVAVTEEAAETGTNDVIMSV